MAFFSLLFSGFQAQNFRSSMTLDGPSIKVKRSGPYVGVQQGKYNFLELGGELQLKKVKLIRPTIRAFRLGMNYNFPQSVLGLEGGYWYQHSRVGLTYGFQLAYHNNFISSRLGLAPALGFRLTQFHLQCGYYFRLPADDFTELNDFFIALKFVLINKRQRKIEK